MSVSGFVRRLLAGEHHCRVILEVPDLGAEGWRRLTSDPRLCWRRLTVSRQLGVRAGIPGRPRRRRAGASVSQGSATAVPALVEASGTESGTALVAKQRLAGRALDAMRAAGLHGELLGAGRAEAAVRGAGVAEGSVWPAAPDVLIFGPAEQTELDRRFGVVQAAWELPADQLHRPMVPAPGTSRRRGLVDGLAALCVLPLLFMVVPTIGPWLDRRSWALFLAASATCVLLPLLVVQSLSQRWPLLRQVRAKALAVASGLLVLLVLARAVLAVPLPPWVPLLVAAVLVAVLTPVLPRLLPVTWPAGLVGAGLAVLLVLVAAPVGDLLDGVYLERLGLRATDVAQTFAQRWYAGAFFGVTALAGFMVLAALWGIVYRLDAVGRRRVLPAPPLLAVSVLVYVAVLLALAAAEAGNQAAPGSDGLPGAWGGIEPEWVCLAVPGGGAVPFAGRQAPPTSSTVVWLGGVGGRYALWSPDTGGATVSDQVQLRVRDVAGPC